MSDIRGKAIMRGLLSYDKPRLLRAWHMGCASFWYTWRYPGPDGPIGFWYSLRGAWQTFVGCLHEGRAE